MTQWMHRLQNTWSSLLAFASRQIPVAQTALVAERDDRAMMQAPPYEALEALIHEQSIALQAIEDRLEKEAACRRELADQLIFNQDVCKAIQRLYRRFGDRGGPHVLLDPLLQDLLCLTDSTLGFIGIVQTDRDDTAFLNVFALSDLSWDAESRTQYRRHQESGMAFRRRDSLIGDVLSSGRLVICNEPGSDPRCGGLPPGHPPLRTFVGIPVCFAGRLVGMIGLANRPGGYDEALVERIGPGVSALGMVLQAQKEREICVKIEAELIKTRRRLEMACRELSQVISALIHDLKEPLRNTTTYLARLEKAVRPELDVKARECLTFALDSSQRMWAMLQGLRDYSHISNQADQLCSVSAATALSDALSNLRLRIEESGATINHTPLPDVWADQIGLVRLFQNLIGNAIKYRHPGRSPVIHVDCRAVGVHWEFSVTDNGLGFDPSQAERIFVLFQRLQAPDACEGNGVGLAIARLIVERCGGHIWAESRRGQGSRFVFILPAVPTSEHNSTVSDPEHPP